MFAVHPDFETPPDEARLWRYMDVGRFLALLKTKVLYFARKSELDDPWEGAHPAALTKRIVSTVRAQDSDAVVSLFKIVAEQALLNCWHENEHESVAMWSLYTTGREGVAIQATIKRLKDAFQAEPYAVTIGRVRYVDYIRDEQVAAEEHIPLNAMAPLLSKRVSFRHEREVRAVIAFPDEPALRSERTESRKLGETIVIPSRQGGMSVVVDLGALIERIVTSPTYPTWAISALQDAIRLAGLSLDIQRSDLLHRPA